MQTIVITGGNGLVGTALSQLLIEKGYKVIVLSRSGSGKNPEIRYAKWDVDKYEMDEWVIGEADYIVHLAGTNVMESRWDKLFKQKIIDSRVNSSNLIVQKLKANEHKVKAIISASAIGYYGPDREAGHWFKEDDAHFNDFLGTTCYQWEQSIMEAIRQGVRVCCLRTGIVLSKDAGAYRSFRQPVQFGIAPVLASGSQMISWIHINDLVHMYLYCIEKDGLSGPFNAVSPCPVSNSQMMGKIAEKVKGSFFLKVNVPSFILKAALGERSVEILKSVKVSSEKVQQRGFHFLYPQLDTALDDLEK